MWWRFSHNRRNPVMLVFGLMLFFGVLAMVMRGGGVPVFFFFFFGGPWLFHLFRQTRSDETAYDAEADKRKNDDFAKAKNDDRADEPVGYLMTDDGEVMEIIEDHPPRRHNDLI